MAQTRPEISRNYRRRRKARIAAIAGESDASLLPVRSLSKVRNFCEAMETLEEWDDNSPAAIAKAHDLALARALELLGLADDQDQDGVAGNAEAEK